MTHYRSFYIKKMSKWEKRLIFGKKKYLCLKIFLNRRTQDQYYIYITSLNSDIIYKKRNWKIQTILLNHILKNYIYIY